MPSELLNTWINSHAAFDTGQNNEDYDNTAATATMTTTTTTTFVINQSIFLEMLQAVNQSK